MTDTHDAYEDDQDLPEPDEFEDGPEPLDTVDADAFFAAEVDTVRPASITLYGEEYILPTSAPLAFTLLAEQHAESTSLADLQRILVPVFGRGTLDRWVEHGMNGRQFAIVLAWAAANMDRPGSLTFERAVQLFDDQDQAARGKAPAPNRAARRQQQRAGSGRRSSRTGGL